MMLRCNELAGIFDEEMKKDLSAKQRTESKGRVQKKQQERRIRMKFKVGDKVKVREDLLAEEKYGGCYFASKMSEYKGRISEIEEVKENNYVLKDCGRWRFTDEMLEPANEGSDYMEEKTESKEVDVLDIVLDKDFGEHWNEEKGKEFRKAVIILLSEKRGIEYGTKGNN